MTPTLSRSFCLALVVHALVAALLCLLWLHTKTELRLPAPPSFVLVGSDELSSPSAATAAVPPSPVGIRVPRPVLPPVTPAEPAAKPPEPIAPSRSHSQPAPASTASTLHSASPRTNIGDYRRRHPTVQDSPARTHATVVPHVSETFPLSPKPGVALAATSTDSHELAFVPALLRDLRDALAVPGPDCIRLSTTVEFRLAPDGSIAAVHLVHSSGRRDFDAAVLAAFHTVRARSFQSTDVGVAYELTFRATDN